MEPYWDVYDMPEDERKAMKKAKPDMVHSPPHYVIGGIETVDVIEAKLSQQEWRGYLMGNILKYVTRHGYKSEPKEDLEKAQYYLKKLIKSYE